MGAAEWGPLVTKILTRIAPFVVWAAAHEAQGNFVMPPRSASYCGASLA